MAIEKIIQSAIKMREAHFAFGRPMRPNEGFKEANIAHDLSAAFRKADYYVFPEFPHDRGSIDAVFVKDSHVVVCEWKRLYIDSIPSIAEQTNRLLSFRPSREFPQYEFKEREWDVSQVWVCDTWEEKCVDWWRGTKSTLTVQRPFDSSWQTDAHVFPDFAAPKWYPYHWVWAIRHS